MSLFKGLTKSLLAIAMIGALSACTTTNSDGVNTKADSSENTAPAKVDPKQAKIDTLNKIDEALENVFNESSGLF